jgi:formate-dependent nitrite reductase cytochrome c552 subunit
MMKSQYRVWWIVIGLAIPFFLNSNSARSQSTLNCKLCHNAKVAFWKTGHHANTQKDIADELAANWAGQTPDSVINGSEAENCVACHSPAAVAALGGMTEVQVMGHFFTTTDGSYTDSTTVADTANWPHVACVSCHNVPGNHPSSMPTFAVFNSTTKQYDSVQTTSQICGQCHGTLRFPDTDHRVYDAWKMSRHGHRGQMDVAGELAASWAGQPADSVINGSQAENCIACHAPTSSDPNHGVTEVEVLNRFFTTTGGLFDSNTTVTDTMHWSDVACATCHDPHKPDTLAYFNSTTGAYEYMASSDELCGQCHGTLRFPDTDHRSYDIEIGTGGDSVADHVTMPGATCVDCHMYRSDVDGSTSRMFGGHTWSIFVSEGDGSITTSCTTCHAGMSADSATNVITNWQSEYATLDSIAHDRVASAESALIGGSDSLKLRHLAEAQHNLDFADMDESGGFHNHNYTVALLNDAIQKATSIITGVVELPQKGIPLQFKLYQNYPNPFNPSTIIRYDIAKESFVVLKLYNVVGQEMRTLVRQIQSPGSYTLTFPASDLPSGIYFYQLRAGSYTEVRKMILAR